MYKIAIVEDEEKYYKQLYKFVRRFSKEKSINIEIDNFNNGLDFLAKYKKDSYDIVFMDIEMPFINGIETAKRLRKMDEYVCLFFVTNMAQYAIDGYAVNAIDYMLKPLEYINVSLKLEKAISIRNQNIGKKISILTAKEKVIVALSDIYFIESNKHYVYFHTSRKVYIKRDSLKTIAKDLEKYNFACCTGSYLINLKHIQKVNKNEIIVQGTPISISRSNKKEFLDRLTIYLAENTI